MRHLCRLAEKSTGLKSLGKLFPRGSEPLLAKVCIGTARIRLRGATSHNHIARPAGTTIFTSTSKFIQHDPSPLRLKCWA